MTPSQKAADDLSNAMNSSTFDAVEFAQQVRRDHRTLQQNTMRAVLELLKQWAEDAETGHFDARNEATVKASQAVVDYLMGPRDQWHLPYI